MKLVIPKAMKLDSASCPCCRAKLDGLTPIDPVTGPRAGDVTVCAYCATILVFEPDLSLRIPTPAEEKEIACDDRITAVHQAVFKLAAEREKSS